MPKNQIDYTETIVYKLCCNDTSIKDIYVGHTTNFEQRKSSHRRNVNTSNKHLLIYEFIRDLGGWKNWSMIQVEKISCQNKQEALARERYWIEKLGATLNCNNPITSKEEKDTQKKCWYEEKKLEILQKAKENYEENKEKKLEYQKQYAEKNKEKIFNYQKEYQDKNKEKICEQKKDYREKHNEEITKAGKEWREANKEKIKNEKAQIISCECGTQYTFGNKHKHLQSKKHIEHQDQLCGIFNKQENKISNEEQKEIQKQKQKEYVEKKYEKIKEIKMKYNEINKEKNKFQAKKYYEDHKEEILEKTKKYQEAKKEKIKDYKDEWYQKNKEKILQKQKETFLCECGSSVRCVGKAEHYESLKHKNFIGLANKTKTDAFEFSKDF
jgi:hypothetical protein